MTIYFCQHLWHRELDNYHSVTFLHVICIWTDILQSDWTVVIYTSYAFFSLCFLTLTCWISAENANTQLKHHDYRLLKYLTIKNDFKLLYILCFVYYQRGCICFSSQLWHLALAAEWEAGFDLQNISLPAGKKLHIVALEKRKSSRLPLVLFLSSLLSQEDVIISCSACSLCLNPWCCDWQAHYYEASNADEEENQPRWSGDKYRTRTHYKVFNSTTGEVFTVCMSVWQSVYVWE